jgi:hypothetical protein
MAANWHDNQTKFFKGHQVLVVTREAVMLGEVMATKNSGRGKLVVFKMTPFSGKKESSPSSDPVAGLLESATRSGKRKKRKKRGRG